MNYKIVYTRRSVRDIQGLPADIQKRIGETMMRYCENPVIYCKKLSDSKLGAYRFRIGDYRVVFDIKDDEIVVLRVGHRREIYKRGQ